MAVAKRLDFIVGKGLLEWFCRIMMIASLFRPVIGRISYLCLGLSYVCLLSADEPIRVFASIQPQRYFIERIGGEHVDVSVMVKAGHAPETYEPTLQQVTRLAKAELFFLIGIPFEAVWLPVLRDQYQAVKLVYCCKGDGSLDHEHPGVGLDQPNFSADPHIWTSPIRAGDMAASIYRELAHLRPHLAQPLRENYLHLLHDLQRLDEKIKSNLHGIKRDIMLVSHPAWGYFAQDYGLVQVSLTHHGHEPHAARLVELAEFAQQKGVRTIFVQPQFNQDTARVFAKMIQASLVTIDPLAEDYLANMKYVSEVVAAALK